MTTRHAPPVLATTDLLLGSEVTCTDGPAGALVRVVVDPDTHAVTHLVVGPRHGRARGHLVPVGLLAPADRSGLLTLDCTLYALAALQSSEHAELIAAGSLDDPLLGWPFYGIGGGGVGMGSGLDVQALASGPQVRLEDRVPDGEVEVRRHEEALGTDGVVGRVRGLRMTDQGHLVSQVLLGVGHRWDERLVAVPAGAVTGMREVLSLDLSTAEVEAFAAAPTVSLLRGAVGTVNRTAAALGRARAADRPLAELRSDFAAATAATDLAVHLAAGQVGRDGGDRLLQTLRSRHEVLVLAGLSTAGVHVPAVVGADEFEATLDGTPTGRHRAT